MTDHSRPTQTTPNTVPLKQDAAPGSSHADAELVEEVTQDSVAGEEDPGAALDLPPPVAPPSHP